MSKSILVAGGSGFIGSHLCSLLIKNGETIVCVDKINTGKKRNITSLLSNSNFTFIQGDICNNALLTKLKKFSFSQIYHLASPASVDYVTKHPVETALTNSLGTKNLLELAKNNNAKLLFASSSEAYGDPLQNPQNESYWGNVNPVGVRSGYDEGKRFGEALCMAYQREYGVETRIARIFNTYGPNSSEHDTRVIPQFISQALQNKDITVHGDGSQTRSFCYVTDTVQGLIQIMKNNDHEPFNIGNPDEYTIQEIAQIIIKLTKSKSKIVFTERPKDDPSLRKPDISRAEKSLQWKPQTSFMQGLNETITYFIELLPTLRT